MSFNRRFAVAAACWLLFCAGCNDPTNPTTSPNAPPPPQVHAVAVYSVTMTASSSCADKLPPAARVRQYVATLYDSGALLWAGPTLHPATHSAAKRSGDSFTFVVGSEITPNYYGLPGYYGAVPGISDVVDQAGVLDIDGDGTGTVRGNQITGTFSGQFAYYAGAQGRNADSPGVSCSAADHGFTFTLHP